MSTRHALAIGLLSTAAVLFHAPTHAAEAAKEPKTGRKCVIFLSSQSTVTGQTRMNYRNICTGSFEIRIRAGENIRKKSIEPGSPEKPSTAYITCQPDDRCEVAKWDYE